MEKRFDGKVAWITGGGSGIGRALALELAGQGAAVAVSGRRADRLAQVVADIAAFLRGESPARPITADMLARIA